MRLIGKVDANQAEIVAALRQAGAKVHPTHQLGGGFPDLLVGYNGILVLVEVKDGAKQPSRRRLTRDEQRFYDTWIGFPVYVIESVPAALALVQTLARTEIVRRS